MSSLPLGSLLISALVRHYEELVAHVRHGPAGRWSDRDAAREVVHDVCAELIAAVPQEPPRTPLAFLRTVCTRRAIDRWRQDQRHALWITTTDAPPDLPSDTADPARILDSRQRLALLADIIHGLPVRCREVFTMHRIHGLPHEQIAQHLGISTKTVEKHLRLGTTACHARLAEALQEPPR